MILQGKSTIPRRFGRLETNYSPTGGMATLATEWSDRQSALWLGQSGSVESVFLACYAEMQRRFVVLVKFHLADIGLEIPGICELMQIEDMSDD